MTNDHVAYISKYDLEASHNELLDECYPEYKMGYSTFTGSDIWNGCATETDIRIALSEHLDYLGENVSENVGVSVEVTTYEDDANKCLTCEKVRTYEDADSWSDDPNYCDECDPDLIDDVEE